MGSRLVLFGLTAVVLTALIPATADARTWTDRKGNQVRGEFVRMHEGLVILSQSGKVGKYPFHEFSEEDQDYVREQLEAKGQADLVPPKVDAGTAAGSNGGGSDGFGEPFGDSAEEEESTPGVEREWADKNGRKMQAQFLGVSGEKVKFLKDGQEVSFGFFDFSMADQNYIKSLLVSQGKESEIPKQQSGAGFRPEGGMAGSGNYPGSGGYPGGNYSSGSESGYPGASSALSDMRSRMNRPSIPSRTYPSPPAPSYSSAMPSSPTMPTSPTMPYSSAMPSHAASAEPRSFGPDMSDFSSPGQQAAESGWGTCSECNAIVPPSIGAGGSCPNCGCYFSYEEDEQGNRTRAKPGKYTTALNVIVCLVIGVVSLVVFIAKVSG